MDDRLPQDASLYIFDFCGTLFEGNTTKDYLAFLAAKSSARYKAKHYAYWLVAKLLKDLKVIDPDGYITIRVKTLRGFSRHVLVEQAQAFLDEYLSKRANQEILGLLLHLNTAGKGPIVLSNTLSLILRPFAEKHGLTRCYGSEIAFDAQGKCTGAYKMLLASRGKLHFLRAHYADSVIRQSYFITDDPVADQDLFEYVAYAQQAHGAWRTDK